jgi:hypothetical protein
MASQVLSGASNPSYTNNTGQNVRVVINYMRGSDFSPGVEPDRFGRFGRALIPSNITINWAGVSVGGSSNDQTLAIGRNLSTSAGTNRTGNGLGLPTEIILAPGQAFSAVCQVYNIVVIPENG